MPGDTTGYWVKHTNPQYPAPTTFFEYDPVGNTFVPINGPQFAATAVITDDIAAYQTGMLALPDGTILYARENTDLYVYNPLVSPSSSPLAVGKPTISTITTNVDGSYHLTGTKLNGISQGAGYGDDAQMDSNYPIARFTAPNGDIIYGRTFNWSSTGVMTGSATVSTEFTVPNNIFGSGYSLVVSANGNASNPISFAGPIWVDFTYGGAIRNGSFDLPYNTLASGIAAVPAGGTLHFKGPRTSNATLSGLSTPMTWVATGGAVTIGR